MVNFESILANPMGSLIISVILGLGIAAMFRKVCKDRNCIVYRGAKTKEIEGNIYEFDSKCYEFKKTNSRCKGKNNLIKQKSEDD
jgi:hypothetical protein